MKRFPVCIGSDSGGAVAPTVALSLFALVGAAGIAFDYARMASLDTELQSAADQAALAAASQLDGEDQTCERAVEAARELLVNQTVMGNDGGGLAVTIADSLVCNADNTITDDPNATVRFFQDKAAATPSTEDSNANFVEVSVDARRANFALTPVVGAFSSGMLQGVARAGLGTALCRVPPLMVCPPSVGVDWNAWRGRGVRAVSNTGPTWSAGNFGYLGPNDANSTQIGLAFENPVFQCQEITGEQDVSTGGPAPAIRAINTRFGIYDTSGGALAPCDTGACPAALNVTKDLVNTTVGQCGTRNAHNNGNDAWHLPSAGRFVPRLKNVADTAMTPIDSDGVINAMGLSRDNMHYCTYNGDPDNANCASGYNRFGDGQWARGDYFNRYHAADVSAGLDPSTWTRYETYLWEIANSKIPNQQTVVGSTDWQLGVPRASCGGGATPDPTRDRRVLQVAVASNCGALQGSSVPAQIETWVEMFLVEPGVGGTGRGNGDGGDEIYLEIIREVDPGGAAPQVIRRDTPYLVR
jgi:Flp pilus assembly protein TadG